MRKVAGNRGIDAARDARPTAGTPPEETSDQAGRRKLRQAAVRARKYLSEMRSGPLA